MRYTLAIVKAPRGRVLGAFNWWGWWDLNPLPSLHWWTVKEQEPQESGGFAVVTLLLSFSDDTTSTHKSTQ